MEVDLKKFKDEISQLENQLKKDENELAEQKKRFRTL